MKKIYFLLLSITSGLAVSAQDMVITGVFDGPLTGGTPKVIEIYVINNIADLSLYGFGSANNGGGTDGQELTFSGSASAGQFIYIASEQPNFNAYFGFNPDFVDASAGINGDDALELFFNGTVIDTFGDINVDGTGTAWDHVDGWAYRNSGTGPDGTTFVIGSWSFSGIDAADGCTTNASCASVFPIGTYSGTLSSNFNEIENFRLYPNPVSNGKITISTQRNLTKQIAIYDILGKQVLSQKITSNQLSVASLNKGVYLLRVTEEGKTTVRKLIVQ